jgi:hypothetical protein
MQHSSILPGLEIVHMLLIRPLNVLTVRAELVEAQAAFRQTQGERILKLHEAGSISGVEFA